MIYNTRNQINDTIESQKEKKICFDAHAGGKWNLYNSPMCSKQANKMWSLKSLVSLFLKFLPKPRLLFL